MSDSPFVKYASGELSPDETYTVELIVDQVRSEFDDRYWDDHMEESEAREEPDYQPSFKKEHLESAAPYLETKTWISLQRVRPDRRPVRDLTAIKFFAKLTGLALKDNEVSDLTPLSACVQLRRLLLPSNPIRDISPLASCRKLQELNLAGTAIQDLSALEELPELDDLTISESQIPAFRRLPRLASLRRLWIHGEFDSFRGFPDMPSLRVIIGPKVSSLDGLERFASLENLVNLSGEFDSLEPLRGLRRLTHFNAWGTKVATIAPLAELVALRYLRLDTKTKDIDISPLSRLPALHDVCVKSNGREHESLAKIRADLTSWDVEFLADKPRFTPSLTVEVVDEDTFEHFNTEALYGVEGKAFNESLIESESGWLEARLEEFLSVRFKEEDDYLIHQSAVSRSLTVVLVSKRAMKAFAALVLGMQEVLATARNDFIIYFQSDDFSEPHSNEFAAWVYPDKIQVTKEYAATVERLIKPRGLRRFFGS